jgi:GH25 family lysozyme M1 (1,4-beta-N-acetylmuramidase)
MKASALLLCLVACDPSGTARRAHPGPLPDDHEDTAPDTADSAEDTDAPVDPWASDPTDDAPLLGVDVSRWNGTVDWEAAYADGVRFVMVKATESDWYQSPTYQDQYDGAYSAGMIRGAYHFATPDDTDGATQARWFVENGGDWTADGYTLPGVLDIEYNPYGSTCYGLSKSDMIAWITDFNEEYIALTGRAPLVYTNQDWWNSCVGSSDLPQTNPLWVAYWSSGDPALPSGWDTYTFWQYTAEGSVEGVEGDVDLNRFPGSTRALRAFALGE